MVINKVSGEKYLQYNTNYLNDIFSPLEKLNLENQFGEDLSLACFMFFSYSEEFKKSITQVMSSTLKFSFRSG